MMRSIALVVPAFLLACASAAEPPASPAPSALDTLRAGGSFDFVLDESAPGATQHTRCGSEHPGDEAGEKACYEQIRQVASHEGIRFSVDGQGRLVWTSYGMEDGKPVTYVDVPLTASLEAGGVVAAKLADRPRGLQVEHHPMDPSTVLRFQVVDANTVVTVDPGKGKLVFRRSSAVQGS